MIVCSYIISTFKCATRNICLKFSCEVFLDHLSYDMRPSGGEANPAVLSCLCCLSLFGCLEHRRQNE